MGVRARGVWARRAALRGQLIHPLSRRAWESSLATFSVARFAPRRRAPRSSAKLPEAARSCPPRWRISNRKPARRRGRVDDMSVVAPAPLPVGVTLRHAGLRGAQAYCRLARRPPRLASSSWTLRTHIASNSNRLTDSKMRRRRGGIR